MTEERRAAEDAIRAAVLAEREACAKAVCHYCRGEGRGYGPAAQLQAYADGWWHEDLEDYKDVRCAASAIWERGEHERQI